MEEFYNSLPEDGKRAVADVDAYFKAHTVRMQEWNGVQLIPFFSMEASKFAYEKWLPREGDVFVVTYPKAGTHWMDEIVKQIIFMGDKNYDLMNARAKGHLRGQEYLESGPASKFIVSDYLPGPRIFDTHLPEQLINYEKIVANKAKVIYVYRNPKDLALSYYHFQLKLPYPEEMMDMKFPDWSEFLQSFVAGQLHTAVPLGKWYPYHIESWIKHRGDGTTMFISFEDLKKDLRSEARKIAKFLGVDRNEDDIQEIARLCTFDTMKERKKDVDFSKIMYRKGQVGEWKEMFTVAQSEMMDEKLEKDLAGVDIEFTYEI